MKKNRTTKVHRLYIAVFANGLIKLPVEWLVFSVAWVFSVSISLYRLIAVGRSVWSRTTKSRLQDQNLPDSKLHAPLELGFGTSVVDWADSAPWQYRTEIFMPSLQLFFHTWNFSAGKTFQAMLLHHPSACTQWGVPALRKTMSPGRWT